MITQLKTFDFYLTIALYTINLSKLQYANVEKSVIFTVLVVQCVSGLHVTFLPTFFPLYTRSGGGFFFCFD